MPLLSGPTTPNWQRHQALTPARFGLFPFRSPLLRESLLLSFPRGTEMFQFPRFPLPALCVQTGVTLHDECRVSPFGHPRICARSAAPRGFSQPPTSFIGSRRQGIHRWLFVAWKNKDARARSSILKERDRRPRCSRGRTTVRRDGAGGVPGPVPCEEWRCRSFKTEQRIRPGGRARTTRGRSLRSSVSERTAASASTGNPLRPSALRPVGGGRDSLERR